MTSISIIFIQILIALLFLAFSRFISLLAGFHLILFKSVRVSNFIINNCKPFQCQSYFISRHKFPIIISIFFFAQISLFICFVFGLKVVNRATEKLENPCKLKLVFLNRKSLEKVGVKTVKFVIFL